MSPAALPIADRSTEIVLSDQQQAVLDWAQSGTGSAVVEAVAGSGKTFTLNQLADVIPPSDSIAYAVFNKSNADEAKRKMGHIDNLSVGTCHSFGFAAWRGANNRIRVDAWDKTKMLWEDLGVTEELKAPVRKLVSLAKQGMVITNWGLDDTYTWQKLIDHFGVTWQIDNYTSDVEKALIEYAKRGVEWSIEVGKHLIDFDDMIWLPLVLNVPIKQYDWVLLDEAQDLNVSRQLLAQRMLRDGGRLVAVGDRNQAIYGFSGADAQSLGNVAKTHNCCFLPLSTTYRCSKAAAKLAQSFVPHIEPHENNEEGSVSIESFTEFIEHRVLSNPTPDAAPRESELRPTDAILCRLNRPLVATAFRLIQSGIGCYVEGRDIGKSLETLVDKWKVTTVPALVKNLENYRQRETRRLMERDAKAAIEALNDRIETLFIIMENCDTVAEVRNKITTLFKDGNGNTGNLVTLSTVHKAKGREWDRVFILGWSDYMPSKWATKGWEKEQERNLQYVAVTRTKRDLVLVNGVEGG